MVHLFQVGVGSGGGVVLDLLARDDRISRVTIVDPDVYQPHNVPRHLFSAAGVGRLKVDLARDWLADRRPDLNICALAFDLTDPDRAAALSEAVAGCDLGVCAVDNEPAKYHFDQLFRTHRKPWTLGEVLAGGIGGWIHRFRIDGPCYGCVAGHLSRAGPTDTPAEPAADYAQPNGAVAETRIPASRSSISAIASLHAVVTAAFLDDEPPPDDWTSLLVPLVGVPGVFDVPFRTHRVRVDKSLSCLMCSAVPVAATGEDLDVALDQALGRLGHE